MSPSKKRDLKWRTLAPKSANERLCCPPIQTNQDEAILTNQNEALSANQDEALPSLALWAEWEPELELYRSRDSPQFKSNLWRCRIALSSGCIRAFGFHLFLSLSGLGTSRC